jgi:predicted GIY-YIG superfamily endonuclease
MQEISYVYILASGFKHLYIGVTANLDTASASTKMKQIPRASQPATT